MFELLSCVAVLLQAASQHSDLLTCQLSVVTYVYAFSFVNFYYKNEK